MTPENQKALDAFLDSDASDFLDDENESFGSVAEKVWHIAWQAALTAQAEAQPADDEVLEAIKWASAIVKDGELVECDYVHLGKEPVYVPYLKALIRAATQQPEQQDNEWFFRWAARAMADGNYQEAISTIFHHPQNPYAKNNPWEKTK